MAAVAAGQSTPALLDTYDAERRPIAELGHEQIFARADHKAYLKTPKSNVPVLDDDAIELGQVHRSAAVLGAGPELPPAKRPDQWAGQPGTRDPHLWVAVGGEKRSILDLFQRGWVLLSEDGIWEAAARTAEPLGAPLTFVGIGTSARPLEANAFRAAYGLDATGATLVRPDGYIAWRAPVAPADPARTFLEAFGRVSLNG